MRPFESPVRWRRALRGLVLVYAAAVGTLVAPAAASAELQLVVPSAPVSGSVAVAADAPAEASPVTFEWSPDEGAGWLPIGVDGSAEDGFTAICETAGFSGSALIRATAATGEVQEQRVEVDNILPTLALSTKHPRFSPNGDGRRDTVRLRLATDEAGTLTAVVRTPGGRMLAELAVDKPVEAGEATLSWDGMRALRRGAARTRVRRAAEGGFVVEASLTDAAGNVTTVTGEVVVDTTPPRLSWHVVGAGAHGSGSLRVRFHSRDRGGEVMVVGRLVSQYGRPAARLVRKSRRAGRADYLEASLGSVVPGAYRVELEVRDEAGNVRTRSGPLLVTGATTSQVIRRLPAAGRRVALTFDDCHESAAWSSILETLAAHEKHASFFCPGAALSSRRPLALRTLRDGHTIGSHGWDHADLRSSGYAGTMSRLNRDRKYWWRTARVSPAPYIRPPYGSYDASTLAAAGDAGYRWTVMWDVDPYDWRRPGSGVVASRVLGAVQPGSIVVLHTIAGTARDLPAILRGLRARGLEPVSLDEMFAAADIRPRRR